MTTAKAFLTPEQRDATDAAPRRDPRDIPWSDPHWDELRATAQNAHLSPEQKRAQIEALEDSIGYGLTDEQKAERAAKRDAAAKAATDRKIALSLLATRLEDERCAVRALDFYVLSRVAESDAPHEEIALGLSAIARSIVRNMADIQSGFCELLDRE